ncbi:hypothetical protein C8A00DRAFT_32502 [Chaetomidium leptoderma]|uniref:F-box domain-containing protein n=1 Tax=Chaetomidium leptoderma TaxID=669021 RepID=A0AAN6VN62_9PEZI|nr:hypothetical protein C8A00DRAFT_32502 [Chaetomidium leptoderma]
MPEGAVCHLGALPPELFDKIFFELDSLCDLANFIAASRFRAILLGVLQNVLGLVLADARFLFLFPYSDPTNLERYHDSVHTMAAVYRDMLLCGGINGGEDVWGNAAPSLGELTQLCRTLRTINFLVDVYVAAQQRWFQAGGEGH